MTSIGGGRLKKVGEMSKEERDRAGEQARVRVMLELGVSGSIVRSTNEVRAAFHFVLPARSGVRHRAKWYSDGKSRAGQ